MIDFLFITVIVLGVVFCIISLLACIFIAIWFLVFFFTLLKEIERIDEDSKD